MTLDRLQSMAALVAGLFLVNGASADAPRPSDTMIVYFGTYTGGESKGIYIYRMDAATGSLTPAGVGEGVVNPSFLALHPGGRFLYAACEAGNFGGRKTGAVAAFSLDPKSGALTLLNQESSEGTSPCHVAVDRSGKNLLVANYSSGTAAVLPIREDGRLGPASSVVKHSGSGPDRRRQEGPHAHSINLDPANRFAFVADLGLDKVMIYRFDPARGTLVPNDPPSASTAPGAGPRHFSFHPNGRYAYVINELNSTVTAFAFDAEKGALREIHSVPTLPGDFKGTSTTAEVQVTPDGKFLYGSNRGHDSLAVFAVDAETGKLSPAGFHSTQGKTPRNFGIDPSGRWLLAANQGSGSVAVFRIDAKTGKLDPAGTPIQVPKPVCVKFLPAP
jgi:6-phosphogluconolactonase